MRICDRCLKNRNERFFRPAGKICLPCQRKSRSAAAHAARVQRTYGLLPGEFDALLAAQGGGCAICGGVRTTRLDVDHDHKTGLVRGLLCRMHNRRLLPAAKDSPELLIKAAEYLKNPPAVDAIGERYASQEGA